MPAPAAATAPAAHSEPQPAPLPTPQSAATASTILSGLFAAPAQASSAKSASRDLTSVFARLAGMPGRDRSKPGGGRS
jgi:hypothetical protein